jgi:hypothetical protein
MTNPKHSNAEFQHDTDERLAKHDMVLATILAELQNLSEKIDKTEPPPSEDPKPKANHKPYLKL